MASATPENEAARGGERLRLSRAAFLEKKGGEKKKNPGPPPPPPRSWAPLGGVCAIARYT